MRNAIWARASVLALFVSFGGLAGCMPHTQHTATPVERFTFSLVPGATYGGPPKESTSSLDVDPEVVPSPQADIRIPFGSSLDMGVGLGLVRLKADLNWALINTPNFALSVAPAGGIGLIPILRDSHFLAEAPLFLDVVKTRNVILTLGGKVGFAQGAFYGGSVGAKIKTGSRFALMPGIDAIYYPDSDHYRRYYVSAGLGIHLTTPD